MNKWAKNVKFIIGGFVFLIILLIILFSNHLNNIKSSKAFDDFNKNSNYEVVLNKIDNCSLEKNKLFSHDNYEVFGFCTKNIYIKYKNNYKRLEELINKDIISLDDLISRSAIISSTENIKNYQINEKVKVRIDTSYKDYMEVIFD